MTLPRFSLRVLLLAVAVLCAGLAWERSVVVERRAARAELEGRGAAFTMAGASSIRHTPIADPPWLRRLFGDVSVEELIVDAADVARAKELYPEAVVWPRH